MDTIEVNGAELAVAECGAGRDIVLVHGSASDRRTWAAQRAAWCDVAHVISYSRRYHRPNAPIDGDTYSLEEHVADLAALIRALDAGPAVVVGHSYGGVIGLLLAARSPALVDALVAIEPPVLGLFGDVPPRPLQLLKLAVRRPRTALGILRLGALGFGPATSALEDGDVETAARRLGTAILGREAFEAMDDERRAQARENTFLEELKSPEAMPRLEPSEIRSVECPVLLVGGARSPAVFARLLDHLQTLLPDAERATVPDASHIVHEDRPARFHRVVESFLERRGGLAATPR